MQRHAPALAEAASLVGGPTIRAMGTLGGNICLDTRCRYYNQSFFWRQANAFCLKKDGDVCHVAPGGRFCWAAFSADTPAALLLYGATLKLIQRRQTRQVPLNEFYGKDGRWSIGESEGGLHPAELLTHIAFPLLNEAESARTHEGYQKLRIRDSIDYPLAGVALRVTFTESASADASSADVSPWPIVEKIAMSLTAVHPRPALVPGTDVLCGRAFDVEAVRTLQQLAHRCGKPMRTTVSDPAYRRSALRGLIEKVAIAVHPPLQPALDAALAF